MEAVEACVDVSVMYEDPTNRAAVLRDKDDDYLVALAQAAGADAIITGDADLLDHDGLAPPALDPRSAYEQIGPGSPAASAGAERADPRELTD